MIRCTVQLRKARLLHGRVDWHGLQVSIENRPGSIRRGVDRDGTPWETVMLYPYGYILKTEGADGEHVDVYLGPDINAPFVYCITTRHPPDFTRADEDKCMLGFPNALAAKAAFLAQYNNPRFFGSMRTMTFAMFKRKVLATADTPGLVRSWKAV